MFRPPPSPADLNKEAPARSGVVDHGAGSTVLCSGGTRFHMDLALTRESVLN